MAHQMLHRVFLIMFALLFLYGVVVVVRDMPLRQSVDPDRWIGRQITQADQAKWDMRDIMTVGEIPAVAQQVALRALSFAPYNSDSWMFLAMQAYRNRDMAMAQDAVLMSLRLSFYDHASVDRRLIILGAVSHRLNADDRRLATQFAKWAAQTNADRMASLIVVEGTSLERFLRVSFAADGRDLLLPILERRDEIRALLRSRNKPYSSWRKADDLF